MVRGDRPAVREIVDHRRDPSTVSDAGDQQLHQGESSAQIPDRRTVPLRPLMAAYLLLMALLTAGFYAFPGWHMLLWSAIGVASAAAMVAGVRWHRPRWSPPWWVLAAS